MLVGWHCTAMLLQIQQELRPFFMRALIKQPPTRAFNAEPDMFSIYHLAHARQCQSMKAHRLARLNLTDTTGEGDAFTIVAQWHARNRAGLTAPHARAQASALKLRSLQNCTGELR